MADLSDREITGILEQFGISTAPGLCVHIRTYIALLLKWNAKISLTTVTDPYEICRFHLGESMFAATAVPIADGRLADAGSGPGFPGLPLRLVRPKLELTMIEANTRKAAFLSEVVRTLGLDNANVTRSRIEDYKAEQPYDWITARALGQHEEFIAWARRNLRSSGSVVLWLGEDDANRVSSIPGWRWHAALPIPGTKKRLLLVGTPTQ